MKRSDLTAGQDYGHARSNDWATTAVRGYRETPNRVRVLDTESGWDLHYRFTGGRDLEPVTFTDPTGVTHTLSGNYKRGGPKVLAELVTRSGDRHDPPRYSLLLPAKIRAPWAEAVATFDAAEAQVRAQREARNARVADAKSRAHTALKALGVEPGGFMITDVGTAHLDLRRLEDLAKRLGQIDT